MSHDAAYDFVCAGRNLERADMTTRILDAAVVVSKPRKRAPGAYDSIRWINVLKSLGAYQMYRRHVRSRVAGDEVLRFLLEDLHFPRSLAHALAEAEASLSALPHHDAPLDALSRLQCRIGDSDTRAMDGDALHRMIDRLQTDLNRIHERIWETWFRREQAPQRRALSA
jgi:uncharacterized alpha-E superfamily protein